MTDIFRTADELYTVLHQAYRQTDAAHFIILIAGCSRSGKSTLTTALTEKFRNDQIPVLALAMDAWLVSAEKRKPESTVAERYELNEIYRSVCEIKAGNTVLPPVYDPVTRRRLAGKYGTALSLSRGVLIVEGVVALAAPALLSLAAESIFVQCSDFRRIKRLVHFYKYVKQLSGENYKALILSREKEEVPFVKNTARNARIRFEWA
jgi:uridine kinase